MREKRHVAEGEAPQKEQGLRTTTNCNSLPWTVGEGLRSDSWGTCMWSAVGEEVKRNYSTDP